MQERSDQFAILVSEPDGGIYNALNKGIAHASGEVVGFLHADDVFAHAYVLHDVAAVFTAEASIGAVYVDLQYVRRGTTDAVVRHWCSGPFSKIDLARGWMPPHPTLYVRREWYLRIGGFDARFRVAADYFSILQLFSQTDFKSVYMPQVLVKMRLGGASNRSLLAVLQKSREDWVALRRSGFGVTGAVYAMLWKNLGKLGQFFDGSR